ncbi:hypothetical protein FRB99_006886 [Tulasnella sp. 403]|nr:hypothetical protein FRB99_006886 [Tulasnella sp. 403]
MNNTVHGALFAGHTPCLRSLFLSGVVADLNTQTFPHVASLNLSFTTTKLGDLSTLLMGCPRLVNLYLDAITFTRQTQDVRGPIFLPDLRTFTIRSPDSPEVAGLLSRIQAPYCRIWCVHEATVGSRFYPPEIIFRPFMEHVAAAAKGSDPFTPARLELGPDRVVCKFGERCYRLGILLSVNYPIWAEVLTKLIAVWGDGRGREVTVESFGWLSPSSHPRIDIPSGWKVLS